MAKFKIKGKKVTGTKKKDKITWLNKKAWKKALTVNAGAGNDVIDFSKSNYKNVLNGNAGNDIIKGGKKNDKITGGKGNDTIYTGKGTNTVVINKGDGNDTVYHQGTKTVIKVNGAKANDTQSFEKKGNDLLLTYTHGGTTTKEVLTFKDYYKGNKNIFLGSQKLENLINAKGTTINGSGNITGTNGNDTITVSSANNTINAGAGDDSITGGSGNDVISGGAGNDFINAGGGKNKIIFNNGDGVDTIFAGGGNDTLVFNDEHSDESGIPTSLYAAFDEHNENDLIIFHNDGSDNYIWAVLKDYGTGEHSAQWINLDGKDIRTDSLIKKHNSADDPGYGDHFYFYGTSKPDKMDIIGDEYYGISNSYIYGYGGDDEINLENAFHFYLNTGKGNDIIRILGTSSGTVNLTAGNGDDVLVGLENIYSRQGLILNPIVTNELGQLVDDSLLLRKNGSFSYILGEQSGEDLIIKLTSGETFTVVDYFNSHVDSSSLQFIGTDNNGHKFTQSVGSYLLFEEPIVAELSSSDSNYEDLAGVMHVVTANESGQYNIKLGDGNNNDVFLNNGEYYNVEIGNGNGNEVKIGDFSAEAPLNAYAEVKAGNGDNNSIALFTTGSYTGVTVGDGEHNSIYIDAPYRSAEPVNTSALITAGHGDGNEIDVTNAGQTIITIGNGDNNVIYSHGTGQTLINTAGSENYYNGEEDTVVGSCYMDVGYNSGDTISTTQIMSYGNDTIKGTGNVNVVAYNSENSNKTIQTNFGQRDVTTKSQTVVNLTGAGLGNDVMHIELQPKSEMGFYTTYFSLVYTPSLGEVPSYHAYDLVYGAIDKYGNDIDGEIVIKDAYIPGIPMFGPPEPISYFYRLNTEDNFILYNSSATGHGLSNEKLMYDLARMNTTSFNYATDAFYKDPYDGVIVKGTTGNDTITVKDATVYALGGNNNITSCGNDRINVTGTDNIYFASDVEDEDSHELIQTHKTVNVSPIGQANIENVMGVDSTLIKYENNVKNVMFSFYGDTEVTSSGNECGYLTLHAFDADGNIINNGDKIYGQMNGMYLDFDDKDESGKILIDKKLTVMYNKDAERNISGMTQYVDMAVIDDEFDVYNYGGTLYIGKGYYVQGTQDDDSYCWEFAGNVTINEQGGNDTLRINADDGMLRGARNTKFIFDVSVTRDAETSEITSVTMGDDIIFVSDFNVGGQIEDFFSTSASTRNSVNTLTVKDYFKSGGANMDNIKISYTQGADYYDIFNYDAFINNNQILQEVTAWLTENSEYSSVMDAISSCDDQTKLNALRACYSADHFEYWTQQQVV